MRIGGYSFVSLLLDPAPVEGGGGTGNDEANDKGEGGGKEKENTSGDADPNDDETAKELAALREQNKRLSEENAGYKSKLTDTEAEQKRKKAEADKAELEKLRKDGDFDKIEQRHLNDLAEQKAEADKVKAEKAELQAKFAKTSVRNELLRELSNYRIAEGWTDKLLIIHGDEFEAIDRGDRFDVQSTDHKSVSSKVKEILTRPEYGRILLAENGGKGAGSTRKTDPAPDNGDPTPSLLDRLSGRYAGRPGVPSGN